MWVKGRKATSFNGSSQFSTLDYSNHAQKVTLAVVFLLCYVLAGLDARAAAIVMQSVKVVAAAGHTVMVTIHQPSIQIFEAFDTLLLLQVGPSRCTTSTTVGLVDCVGVLNVTRGCCSVSTCQFCSLQSSSETCLLYSSDTTIHCWYFELDPGTQHMHNGTADRAARFGVWPSSCS